MSRWKDKQLVGFSMSNGDVKALDRLANKFSMSRSAMLRVAIKEFLNKSKPLNTKHSDTRVNLIADLLTEVGDIVEAKA